MFHIPTTGHPARELFDMQTAVDILHPGNRDKLLAIWQARNSAMAYFAAEKAARRIAYIVVRADTDERWLVSFGRRGGWRKEWNFGTGRTA